MRAPFALVLGIDVGSTTAKAALARTDDRGFTVQSVAYARHEANLAEAVRKVVEEVTSGLQDEPISVVATGSAGMGLAERAGLPFVQEVHAASAYVGFRYPRARALLDIGGEDCKLVFFEEDGSIDARMNGGCAGGTGAFLDQMAALLSVETADLDPLAAAGQQVHPVAMRCGVFAKTDVQNLLSRGVAKADVALSVYHAVACQVISTLTRGRVPTGQVVMTGGPLTFLPTLRRVFAEKLGLAQSDVVSPESGALASAEGAALGARAAKVLPRSQLIAALVRASHVSDLEVGDRPLFTSEEERRAWFENRWTPVPRATVEEAEGPLYLGIDSGSTTTKLVLVDRRGRLVADHYQMNRGEALKAAIAGLDKLQEAFGDRLPEIRGAAVTGYGEDLIRAALGIPLGLVEIEAHLAAAKALAPDVSFVLDIGGQDMKALFVKNGQVRRVEVNEACSSGCGSFLQNFAENLSVSVQELSEAACRARAPRGLGSRCTVFMNSMVKQALREGAGLEEIAAGLAYSVGRNCLHKVLKIRDVAVLGETIVVQGGTFLNPAIQRAFELLIGRRVVAPDAAGLAGAWGAALWARERANAAPDSVKAFDLRSRPALKSRREARCKGCGNHCAVTLLDFEGAGRHSSGNRCERYFHNGRRAAKRGTNHLEAELALVMGTLRAPEGKPRQRVGMPLALNTYENLPFWASLFARLGHELVVSGPTEAKMVEEAIDTLASESVCLPARVASAHVRSLQARGVDTVFFPSVFHEEKRDERTFNCPIVAGYPEVVEAATTCGPGPCVPVSTPAVSFESPDLLKGTARRALESAGIEVKGFDKAFRGALADYEKFKEARLDLGRSAVEAAGRRGVRLVVLACRPYHLDAYLNHRVPDMLADLGYDVLSSQCLPVSPGLAGTQGTLPQWAYPNRILDAADWVVGAENAELVQLNSFGCGPDAVVADEASSLLESKGKAYSLLRVDESTAPGSLLLRLRALGMNAVAAESMPTAPRRTTPPFLASDRRRKLLAVSMEPLLFTAIGPELGRLGYDLEIIGPTDDESQELGLRYVNNEICYPAILTIGDILKALQSGKYDPRETAVLFSQTGGPCRASNYVPLLKKALVTAGFADVPVVTLRLSAGGSLNEQPGFEVETTTLVNVGLQVIAVTDAISMMKHALAPREQTRGDAERLAHELVSEWSALPRRGLAVALDFIEYAAKRMAAVPVTRRDVERVGIVGEIYVKYSPYANHHLAQWLIDEKLEPMLPPMMNFFSQGPINMRANRDAGLDDRVVLPFLAGLADKAIEKFLKKANRRLAAFPYDVRFPLAGDLARHASKVISLNHQYGEGWALAGEVLDMAERGVKKVVCLQPFGCLANQVVARGVERRLRAAHPGLQLLFLDLDHNTSNVNLFNRLQLLVSPPVRLEQVGT